MTWSLPSSPSLLSVDMALMRAAQAAAHLAWDRSCHWKTNGSIQAGGKARSHRDNDADSGALDFSRRCELQSVLALNLVRFSFLYPRFPLLRSEPTVSTLTCRPTEWRPSESTAVTPQNLASTWRSTALSGTATWPSSAPHQTARWSAFSDIRQIPQWVCCLVYELCCMVTNQGLHLSCSNHLIKLPQIVHFCLVSRLPRRINLRWRYVVHVRTHGTFQ